MISEASQKISVVDLDLKDSKNNVNLDFATFGGAVN